VVTVLHQVKDLVVEEEEVIMVVVEARAVRGPFLLLALVDQTTLFLLLRVYTVCLDLIKAVVGVELTDHQVMVVE
jgi:hypothetical protein